MMLYALPETDRCCSACLQTLQLQVETGVASHNSLGPKPHAVTVQCRVGDPATLLA